MPETTILEDMSMTFRLTPQRPLCMMTLRAVILYSLDTLNGMEMSLSLLVLFLHSQQAETVPATLSSVTGRRPATALFWKDC